MVSVVCLPVTSMSFPCSKPFVPLHRKQTLRGAARTMPVPRIRRTGAAPHAVASRAARQAGRATHRVRLPCHVPPASPRFRTACNARASRRLAHRLPRSMQRGTTSDSHESACLSVLSMVCRMHAPGARMAAAARATMSLAARHRDADRPHARRAVRTARMLRVLASASAVRHRVDRRRRRRGADRRGSRRGHTVRHAAAFPQGAAGGAPAARADRRSHVRAFRDAAARHRAHDARRPRRVHHRLAQPARYPADGRTVRLRRIRRARDRLHPPDRPGRACARDLPADRRRARGSRVDGCRRRSGAAREPDADGARSIAA